MGMYDDIIGTGQSSGGAYDDILSDAPKKQDDPGLVSAIKRTGGQMASAAGIATEDVIGKNSLTSGIRKWGNEVQEANPAGVTSFSDIANKPGLYVKESLGNALPQMAPQAIGGIAGRIVGGIAGGLVGGPAGAAVGQEVVGRIGQAIPTFVQEYGGIREQQERNGVDNKLGAVAAAVPATGIEFALGPQRLLGRLLEGATTEQVKAMAKMPAKEIAKSVGKEAVKGGLGEAAEEVVQNPIEAWGAQANPFSTEAVNSVVSSPDTWRDALFSGAMALPGGGIASGGLYATSVLKERQKNPQNTRQPDQQESTPTVPDGISLTADPVPVQQRIDAMLGLDAARMSSEGRKQYEADLVAAFNEPIGIRLDANQNEVPFTMGEYLDSQVKVADNERAKPMRAGANERATTRLDLLAEEEAQHHSAITQDLAQSASQGGALSQAALTGIQTGATRMPVHPERAAIEQQMLADEAAQAELAPIERLMRTRSDEQVRRIAENENANPKMRQVAIADLQRRMATKAQPTTTSPLQQTATQLNMPAQNGIKQLQAQLEQTEPFTEQSSALTEKLQSAVTQDAQSALNAGEMPVYKVTDHVSVAIHPSAQNPGMVQVTRYTKDGVIGDSQYNNVDDAVRQEGLTHKPRIPSGDAIKAIEQSIAAEAEYQQRKGNNAAQPAQMDTQASQANDVQANVTPEPVAAQSIPQNVQVSAEQLAKRDTATVNAEKPAETPDSALQNRDRGRAASVNQMQSIARNPDYMRLGPSRTPDSGAPMVFSVGNDHSAIPADSFGASDVAVMSDGQRVPFRYAVVNANLVQPSNFADGMMNPAFSSIKAGTLKALNNGRSAGVIAAHAAGNAGAYVGEMLGDVAHGVSADVIRSTPNPMLIRVYSEEANTDNMAAKSQGQGLGMSASERAAQDAELMTGDVLDKFAPLDIAAAGNRDFVRAFVGKLPENELADMMDATGNLSQDGRRRIEAALLTAAYGKSDLVQELFESTDTDIKAIGNALKVVSGQWAIMRQAAKDGVIDPATDMTANLIEAVNIVRRSRAEGSSVAELAGQGDLMGGNYLNELSELFLRIFYKGAMYNRARGGEKVIAGLQDIVTSAMNTKADAGLFGDSFKPTPKQIVQSARSKIDEKDQPASQSALFGANGQATAISQGNRGESAAQSGEVGQRPVGTNGGEEVGKQAGPVAQQATAPVERKVTTEDARGQQDVFAQAKYAGPADVSSRAGQMELSNRAGTIAALKGMNEQLRKIAPDEAWADRNIEDAQNLDALRDQISQALVDANRGKPDVNPLRKELEELSGQELKDVFSKLNLAGKLMAYEERISALLMEDAAEVRAAISAVTGNPSESTAQPVKATTEAKAVEPAAVDAKKEAETKTSEQISDFGEKIAGAKKDLWQSYKKAMSDDLPSDAKDITLSKHFPEPDYENLIASGIDLRSVAAIKAMRDEIPAKPRQPFKVRRWAEQLKSLRGFANNLISGDYNIDYVLSKMREGSRAMSELVDRIELYAELGYPAFKSADGFSVSGGWSTDFDRSGNPGKQNAWAVLKNNSIIGIYDDRAKAVDALRDRLAVEPEKSERSIKLDLYKVTSTGDIVIGNKVASNKFIDLKTGFKSAREAREYLKEHESELLELLDKKKKFLPTRRSTNDPRVGKDYRLGEDVTPEKFAAEFGFRGVQFGNYVEQERRAKDLNNAYDALLDLANIIGVPPRAISLNGSLGLAFGARGKGGVDPAAAHYEAGETVINLTKINGAGSLGHEFFHALDNYFSKQRGAADDYLTAKPYFRGEGVRPEVVKAFSDLMKAIKSSDYYKRSASKDKTRSKDYWGTDIELAARAFESYLIAKAEAQGQSNDYLANIISEEAQNVYNEMLSESGLESDPYPYPTKAEQTSINAAFDNLFNTIQTKETDKGVALYSKANTAQSESFPRAEAESRIKSILGDKLGKVLIDSGIVTFTNKGNEYQGATYKDGSIVLNLDALSADNFDGVLLHEGFHSTIRDLVGEQTYAKLMKQLDTMLAMGKGAQWVKDANAAIPSDTKAEHRTEEIAAYSIEQYVNGAKQPNIITRWVESLLSALRTAIIRRLPFGKLKSWAVNNLQPQDLANLAIAGLKAKAQGQLQAQGREAMAFSRNENSANVSRMADKDTVAGTQAPTSAGDGSTGSAKAPHIAAAEQILSLMDDPVYTYGLRVLPSDFTDPVKPREIIPSSFVWQDGDITDEEIDGVSTAGIRRSDLESVLAAMKNLGVTGKNGPNGYYFGSRVVLVRGDSNGSGQDVGETIIRDPEVLGEWKKPNNGLSEVMPNEPSASAGSDVQFSKINQTDTPAFKKWFGDWSDPKAFTSKYPKDKTPVSQAVGEDGKPLVLYHATNGDFSTFEVGRPTINSTTFGDVETERHGIFATDDVKFAEEYLRNGQGKNVMPIYMDIKSPMDMREGPDGEHIRDIVENSDGKIRHNDFYNLPVTETWALFDGDFGYSFVEAAKKAGYDGAIILENTGDRETSKYVYVAFSPTQVKSAIGNNGDFDGTNPDIRYSRAQIIGDSGRQYDQTQRQFFKNVGRDIDKKNLVERTTEYLKNDFWKKMAVGIVDQFRGLRDLGDNGQAYMLARLSKGTAGAFDALLHHGKLSIRDGVYDADTSGGFIDRLGTPLHGELDDFLWYVAANRAEGLSKVDRENLFTPADIAAGKSLAKGQTNFDYTIQTGPQQGTTTRNRTLIYADANRVFNEFQKNTLDMAEQSGLIDGASRKLWESEFYVPFYRVSEEDGEFIGAKMGNALVRQQAFKKLKGGTDKLNSDLLSNTLLNFSHLIEASAKNRAAKASLAAAEQIGVAERVAPDMASYTASNGSMLPPGTKGTVWFQENGKKVEYKVTDPFVMTAITSLEYAGMRNGVMDVMTKFKHWLTIGVTASPAFKVRNLIRDSIQSIGASDLSYNPIKNIAEGYKQTKRDSQEYVSALASGGLIRFGTMLEGSESSRVRQLVKAGVKDSTILNSENKWRAFYDQYIDPAVSAYNELGNRSEEINRAALYNQLIKQGKSHAEAALLARDLMDFSMQGSFNTIRFLTQIVPFMNARLQGLYKLGRSAKDNPKKLAVVTGAVALASIGLMLAYGDDDDWKRREDWDRDNFWWFKFGGVEFRIPKPFEVGAVASLAERGLELMIDDEMTGERFRRVVNSLIMNNLSMNPIPQAFKPILDLYSNKDSFTGRPIESMSMQRLDPTERFNSNTSMIARGMSQASFGALSPVQIDHLARGYFGWLGSFVIGGADMAFRSVSDEPTKPALDYFKFATQGILKEAGTGSSRYVTQLYEQAAELEQAHATYRQMLKDGRIDEAKEYAEDNKDKLVRYRQVEPVKKMESKLNERIRKIERSDMGSDEKKDAIALINKQKEMLAKRIAAGAN